MDCTYCLQAMSSLVLSARDEKSPPLLVDPDPGSPYRLPEYCHTLNTREGEGRAGLLWYHDLYFEQREGEGEEEADPLLQVRELI
jgi:hypothetical protein